MHTRNYGALRAPPLLAPAPRGYCRFHVYNGPCVKKKNWSWPTFEGLEAAGGSWGGQRPSGTTRDQCCGQKEPFEPKKNFGLGRPLMASRPLEGPGGARHRQGPPGINAVVKRNRLSQQKKFRPRPAFDGLGAAGGFWGGRTPSGTIRD